MVQEIIEGYKKHRQQQQEIIQKYKDLGRFEKYAPMYREFSDKMSYMAPTYMTFTNWADGSHVPLIPTLKRALEVYPVGDWRYQMAVELLELQGE